MLKSALKTAIKIVLKNYARNKKEMSFLKISDPFKRDLIVKEYLNLRKNIWYNMINERTGEQQLQTDLSKFFKPITETQKDTARGITEGLKPIRECIENLPQAITFPAYPSIQAVEREETVVTPYFIGDIAESYLRKFTTKAEADRTYGLRDINGKFYNGNKKVDIKENNIEVEDGKEYEGTPGLWELIVSREPKDFTNEDYENYANFMVETNALYRDNKPENNRPKSNRAYKWKTILKDIWGKRKEYEGSGVIVIPSDPNALLERLDLLLSSQEAGHIGVGKYMR